MNHATQRPAPSAVPDASSQRRVSLTDFFRYHGIWAPGVRLFRRVSFSVKSALISLAFLVPLTALGWSYFSQQAEQLAFSRAERTGVAFARALAPMLESAWTLRDQAVLGSGLEPALAAEAKAWDALEAAQRNWGAEIDTKSAFDALGPLRDAARKPAADAPTALEVHGKYLDGLKALLDQAIDGSNLALDPEVLTYYLMIATLRDLPRMQDHLAESTAYGAAALAPGSALSASRIETLLTMSDARMVDLTASTGRATRAGAKQAAVKPVADPVTAFRTATMIRFISEPPTGPAAALVKEGMQVRAKVSVQQAAMLDELDTALHERITRLERARLAMGLLIGATLMVAGYLFRSFFLVILGGLREVGSHIDSMAAGDLTRSPRPWGNDEAASLMSTLAGMQGALRRIVTQVRTGSDSIVDASREIASGSMDLSGRTEQTASALEQSAASMEQISSTVRLTADNARKGAQIAQDNAEVARRGGQVIEDVVQTMQEIQQASAKIANIISVIDGIAFQTNILALNAAVEAARAGEQGRGFAVVASEVRSLSHRSAEAAREIKSLIEETVSKVERGASVVQEAGETMQRIVVGADQLETLSTAIADAANQQDSGVAQVGEAIQELDRGAQQNAALVEQTAAAAGQLQDQAHTLAGVVGTFRLPGGAPQA
jgi:methyl-accepting chemotaxis protein